MSKVTATLGRNFIRSKEFQEAQMMGVDPDAYLNKQKPRSIRHKLVSLTLKRKNKLGEDVRRKLQVYFEFLSPLIVTVYYGPANNLFTFLGRGVHSRQLPVVARITPNVKFREITFYHWTRYSSRRAKRRNILSDLQTADKQSVEVLSR